jgi:hypothetical protein
VSPSVAVEPFSTFAPVTAIAAWLVAFSLLAGRRRIAIAAVAAVAFLGTAIRDGLWSAIRAIVRGVSRLVA